MLTCHQAAKNSKVPPNSLLVNGRIVSEDGRHQASSLSFQSELISGSSGHKNVRRTINASGGYVIPGLITPLHQIPDDITGLCRNGITTALIDGGPAECVRTFKTPDTALDIVLTARIGCRTTPRDVATAYAHGVHVFSINSVLPTSDLLDALHESAVRISADSHILNAWARACAFRSISLVASHVTRTNFARAERAKSEFNFQLHLEICADILWDLPEEMWQALATGTIDLVSTPSAGDVTTLALLMNGTPTRPPLTLNRVVELVSTGPARAAGIAHCKGSLSHLMNADIVVFDVQRPNRTCANFPPAGPGKANLVIRRGSFLFFQEQIHAPPASGIVLR